MTEEKDIRAVVDEDIAHAEAVWDACSYDRDAMEALFVLLMEHHGEKIDGFVKGLRVIQPYEEPADMAEIYETLEECWAKGVVGNVVETPMGPVVKQPSDAKMWEEIYSPAKLARFDALVKAARAKVAPGSLEAKRIDLVDREFLGGLRARSAEYAKFAAGLKALEITLPVGGEEKISLDELKELIHQIEESAR